MHGHSAETRKNIFTAKNSAAKLPTVLFETFFKIFHINIESMLVTGRLAELTHIMDSQRCKLACLSEARCPGSGAFRSGDYLILQSGGDRDNDQNNSGAKPYCLLYQSQSQPSD